MGRSQAIRMSDARALMTAMAEACEAVPDPRQRLVAFADRLCAVIDARLATVCHLRSPSPGAPLTLVEYIEAGTWNGTDRRVLAEYYARGDHEEDLVAKSIADLQRRNDPDEPKPPALRREDLIDDRSWYNSDHFNEFRRASDIDSCIYSGILGDAPGQILGMTFHRPVSGRSFSPRERMLIELAVTGATPLFRSYGRQADRLAPTAPTATGAATSAGSSLAHATIEPKPDASALPPRLREILHALLSGRSEKEAALALGISPHTAHGHVKRLYRHFGVSSRGELMALFLSDSARSLIR